MMKWSHSLKQLMNLNSQQTNQEIRSKVFFQSRANKRFIRYRQKITKTNNKSLQRFLSALNYIHKMVKYAQLFCLECSTKLQTSINSIQNAQENCLVNAHLKVHHFLNLTMFRFPLQNQPGKMKPVIYFHRQALPIDIKLVISMISI